MLPERMSALCGSLVDGHEVEPAVYPPSVFLPSYHLFVLLRPDAGSSWWVIPITHFQTLPFLGQYICGTPLTTLYWPLRPCPNQWRTTPPAATDTPREAKECARG